LTEWGKKTVAIVRETEKASRRIPKKVQINPHCRGNSGTPGLVLKKKIPLAKHYSKDKKNQRTPLPQGETSWEQPGKFLWESQRGSSKAAVRMQQSYGLQKAREKDSNQTRSVVKEVEGGENRSAGGNQHVRYPSQ